MFSGLGVGIYSLRIVTKLVIICSIIPINTVHSSDSVESAEREIKIWFPEM